MSFPRILLIPFAVGCSSVPGIAAALHTADSVGRGVAQVLGWCERNGAEPGDVLKAAENVRRGDYDEALRIALALVREARARGIEVPEDQAAILQLAEELQAARSIEQGMRALSGRDTEGHAR